MYKPENRLAERIRDATCTSLQIDSRSEKKLSFPFFYSLCDHVHVHPHWNNPVRFICPLETYTNTLLTQAPLRVKLARNISQTKLFVSFNFWSKPMYDRHVCSVRFRQRNNKKHTKISIKIFLNYLRSDVIKIKIVLFWEIRKKNKRYKERIRKLLGRFER